MCPVGTVVEHYLTHNPQNKGYYPATGTRRERRAQRYSQLAFKPQTNKINHKEVFI
jgi:hypothetical protein